jgi:hypothetical protein
MSLPQTAGAAVPTGVANDEAAFAPHAPVGIQVGDSDPAADAPRSIRRGGGGGRAAVTVAAGVLGLAVLSLAVLGGLSVFGVRLNLSTSSPAAQIGPAGPDAFAAVPAPAPVAYVTQQVMERPAAHEPTPQADARPRRATDDAAANPAPRTRTVDTDPDARSMQGLY